MPRTDILFFSNVCDNLETPARQSSGGKDTLQKKDAEQEYDHMPRALSLCREGDSVYIHRIGGNGAFKKRLHDLGFRRGKCINVVKYAPLKDPMEVELGGYHVSLRVEEANRIEVDSTAPVSYDA